MHRLWPERLPYGLSGFLVLALLLGCSPAPSAAAEAISFKRGEKTQHVTGQVVVEAVDGGLLVLGPDGRLWDVQPADLVSRRPDPAPFTMLDQEALGKQLLAELPSGFQIHTTAHYVICHNTSKAYAQWCGGLFERLHRGFFSYWGQPGRNLKLAEPKYPLVAIVFEDQADFIFYSQKEVGNAAGSMLGYYSFQTNRMVTYDLTGVQAVRAGSGKRGSAAEINALLAQPQAERTVATIIHEATHQLAFNSGLHQRYGDVPLWWSEGLAMYFESPDLSSDKGWKTIGAVNTVQLARFRDYLQQRRKAGSLLALLADAGRFRDAKTQEDAYAESWALHYFLAKKRPDEYLAYLKLLAAKAPALHDEKEQRIKDFTAIFGDLGKLDADFVRTMRVLR